MMKSILVILFLSCYILKASYAAVQCPKEQQSDWIIELLLKHEDCDKFYKCTHGQPVEMFCPQGLYFNPEISQCDWKHNVDCNEKNETDNNGDSEKSNELEEDVEYEYKSNEADSSSDTEEYLEEDDLNLENSSNVSSDKPNFQDIEFMENGCPVDPLIHWLLPHENDCNLFYYCVWGKKVQTSCPESLHFNPKLQVCDWPDKAGCDKSSEENNVIDNGHEIIQKVEAEVVIKL